MFNTSADRSFFLVCALHFVHHKPFMQNMKKNIFHKRQQSIIISITALIATVIFGSAFAISLVTPTQALAQVGPPCCTLPPILPQIIIPVVPVVLPLPTPTCTLSATPTSILTGSSSNLSYTTTNATSFTVNHSVGSLSPVSSGSKNVSPTMWLTVNDVAEVLVAEVLVAVLQGIGSV